jgi:atypical dual specificity phosphatase
VFIYWIDKQRLAGASEPNLEDFPFLKTFEWGGIVSLQDESSTDELASLLAIPYLHIPIKDFSTPTETDLEMILEFFLECQNENPNLPVLIHCTAGHGRTGTIIAAILVINDRLKPEEAIKSVRNVNPLAIETKEQEDFIRNL